MLTDWLVLRRVAAELDAALRGARIRGAGLTGGRLGLRTAAGLVVVDAFGPTPLVTLEPDRQIEPEPGWSRTVAEALEDLRIERVRARRGDRLIALDAASRSRFGVASGYRLVAELVPRYGNVILLKGDTVVAAAKSFEAGGRTTRTVTPGEAYEPPPPRRVKAAGVSLASALAAFLAEPSSLERRRSAAHALRAAEPLLPELAAESLVAEAAALRWAAPAALETWLFERARALVGPADEETDLVGEAFAYFDPAGRLEAAHVMRLWQFADDARLQERRAPDLLAVLTALGKDEARGRAAGGFEGRRAALFARIEKRRTALAHERAALERERDDAATADTLRIAGDVLYANLSAVVPGASLFVPPPETGEANEIILDPRLSVKANAAAYFRRYKKAIAKGRHVERRLAQLSASESAVAQLAWELERVEPESIDEVADAIGRLDGRKTKAPARTGVRRKPLEVTLGGDARALVGRSPRGNADLTFRIARPDDLWFHARNTPGAHVILRIDGTREPRPDELSAAAALAAFHSRGREAEKVEIDYTERKFVRKRPGGAPGLVWYTNARTLLVAPKDAARL